MRRESKKIIIALTSAALFFTSCFASSMLIEARGIPSNDAFENLEWRELFRTEASSEGTVRSMAITNDYIITVRNVADDESVKDTVTAYYRNDHDANGVSVSQYSEALKVSEDQLEQGNSITYNPKTDKLYLAPSTCYDVENYGQVLVLDPHTLKFEERIFLTYEFGVGGIEYVEDSDSYVVQGNYENDYSFMTYSSEFDQIANFGSADILPSSSARDFTVCGNYIISAAYLDSEDKAYLNIFSLLDGSKITTVQMNIPMDGISGVAPQSVAELSPGQLLVMVNETSESGEEFSVFYVSDVPYNFTVSTAVENGTISENSSEVLRGTDYTVEFKPNPGFALSAITLDGKMLNSEDYDKSITIPAIDADHTVVVRFAEKDLVKKQNKERNRAFSELRKKLDKTAGKRMTFGRVLLRILLVIVLVIVAAFVLFIAARLIKQNKKKRKNKSKKGSGKKSKTARTSSAKRRLNKYRGSTVNRPSDKDIIKRRSSRDEFKDEKEKDYLYGYDDDFYDSAKEDDKKEYTIPSGMRDLRDTYYNEKYDGYRETIDMEDAFYFRDNKNQSDDGYGETIDMEDAFYFRDNKNQPDAGNRFEKTKINSSVSSETRNLDHYYRKGKRSDTIVYGGEHEEDEPLVSWPDEMSDNLVGHWQDGVWVTTSALGPNEK